MKCVDSRKREDLSVVPLNRPEESIVSSECVRDMNNEEFCSDAGAENEFRKKSNSRSVLPSAADEQLMRHAACRT